MGDYMNLTIGEWHVIEDKNRELREQVGRAEDAEAESAELAGVYEDAIHAIRKLLRIVEFEWDELTDQTDMDHWIDAMESGRAVLTTRDDFGERENT